MTTASQGQTDLITDIDKDGILDLFLQGNEERRVGTECEITILKRDKKQGRKSDLTPITQQENERISAILAVPLDYGYDFAPVETSQEAGTFTLEVKTDAATHQNLEQILDDLDRQLTALRTVCHDLGFTALQTAQAPLLKSEDLFDYIVERSDNRGRAFIETFNEHGLNSYYKNFFLNNAAQVSASLKDTDELHRAAVRLACLTAPLATALDNSPAQFEAQNTQIQTGLALREGLSAENRGGLPSFFFTANDGEEFVRNYLDWVLDTPLLALYDEKATYLHAVPKGQEKSFRALIAEDHGLNHRTNFELALGMVWPHVKLAFIKNQDGEITGTRCEARAADMGDWQKDAYTLTVAKLTQDPEFARDIDWLLIRYGFDVDAPALCEAPCRQAIDDAIHYRNRFGTGKMSDFLREFGDYTRLYYAERPALLQRLQPFFEICQSGGLTESLKLRDAFNSYATSAKQEEKHVILPDNFPPLGPQGMIFQDRDEETTPALYFSGDSPKPCV